MKELCSILLLISIVLTGCGEKEEQPGEECSINVSGIHFTRSLNNADRNTKLVDGKITITSEAEKDYFNEPDRKQIYNTAPILLIEVDNSKPFTLTAKLTPQLFATYDAGALYVYSSDLLWQKFAFERDEQDRSRIVSVRTIGTSDDNNHDVVEQESVYLRISSDTNTVGFYYSTDSITWNLARLYRNDYPGVIWLGLSSQSPTGDGNATDFEHITLTDGSVKDFRRGV